MEDQLCKTLMQLLHTFQNELCIFSFILNSLCHTRIYFNRSPQSLLSIYCLTLLSVFFLLLALSTFTALIQIVGERSVLTGLDWFTVFLTSQNMGLPAKLQVKGCLFYSVLPAATYTRTGEKHLTKLYDQVYRSCPSVIKVL